jgi:hypothetical protein
MPNGGPGRGQGRKPGSRNKKTIGITQRQSGRVVAEMIALSEMRRAATLLCELMESEYRAMKKGARNKPQVIQAIRDYIRAQEKVASYENAKLVSVSLQSAMISRIEVVGGPNPAEEGIDEYAGSVEYDGAIVGETAVALEHAGSSIPGPAKTRAV